MTNHLRLWKVKQTHHRPRHAQRVPGGSDSQNFKTMGTWSGKVVCPTHRTSLPTRKYSWYSFLLGAESTPEGICQRKTPMTPLGIEPATFSACSAMPQPTVPPGAPYMKLYCGILSVRITWNSTYRVFRFISDVTCRRMKLLQIYNRPPLNLLQPFDA